jgi:beta-N-acetylhexosaminidase
LKLSLRIFAFIIFLAFIVVSSQFLLIYVDELKANERKDYLDLTAKRIVAEMTIPDKIGQVIHLAIPGKSLDETAISEMRNIRPGGIIHFGKNFGTKEEVIKLNRELQDLARRLKMPPLLISTDQEGGRVFRVRDGVAQFPGAMALGQTNQEQLGYEVGFITSYDLDQVGVNFLLAPSLDVNNNPNNPVINTRSFGSDVDRVNLVAGGYERGARRGGAIPVIKHFPGHGDTDVDSHLGLPIIRKSLAELEKLELIPFQKSIQDGAPVVMSAHILFPKLDDKYPATLSKKILQGILRDKLGFDGVVITDAMEMHAISKNYQSDRPGVLALLAGADILLLTSWGETSQTLYTSLLKAANNGEFDLDGINILDRAVYRQIRLKLEYGIYTKNTFEPKIENENLLSFMAEANAKRNEEYQKLTSNPNFVDIITRQTIRSYPTSFTPLTEVEGKSAKAYIAQAFLAKAWKENGGTISSRKSINSDLKSSKLKYIIANVSGPNEFSYWDNLAKKYPDKEFILLYPHTPFVDLLSQKNVKVLLSFSLTESSFRALAESIYRKEEVPAMKLILKED